VDSGNWQIFSAASEVIGLLWWLQSKNRIERRGTGGFLEIIIVTNSEIDVSHFTRCGERVSTEFLAK